MCKDLTPKLLFAKDQSTVQILQNLNFQMLYVLDPTTQMRSQTDIN